MDLRLDVDDPSFIADPYPRLTELRETTPVFWNERSNQWVLTRFQDVYETLRDRRLGRAYTHRYDHAAFGRPEPDPRWADFHQAVDPGVYPKIAALKARLHADPAVRFAVALEEGEAAESPALKGHRPLEELTALAPA